MKTVHIILVKAFNELVREYNNNREEINYIEVRDFELYIRSKGIDIQAVTYKLNELKQ